MNYFNYNGKILKESDLIAGPSNRGLRYGDGLFETIKVKNGKMILADEHFARLWKGMSVLQFDIPKHFTPERLGDEITTLIKKNRHENAARVRLTVFRGDGGLYDPQNQIPNYAIQSWQLAGAKEALNSNGLVAGIYADTKKSCDLLSNVKHNNFLPYALAALKAKKEKWNDAIVLNMYGRICETTIANIFLIKENIIFTPALGEGCIAGVMRKKIIQEATNCHWSVVEKEITSNDLFNADEVFFTNCIQTIKWVKCIDAKEYVNTVTQKIYAAIFPAIS
jgi:branched-chain amino acid aminotransferase